MKNSIIYTLVFLALQIIATFAVTTTWALINKSTDFSIMPLIISITLFSVLVITVFLMAKWAEVSLNWLLTKQWTVLVWAVIAALGLVIPITWLQEQMPELPNWIEDDLQMLMSSYWGYLAIGLLAPLAEEVVFRGAVLRSLLAQMKPWTAIAISALLFSIVHMNPAQMPFAFLAGILLEHTGVSLLMTAGGFIAALADDALQVRTNTRLQAVFPSEQRATLISIECFTFSIIMIVLSPLAGFFFSIW